MKWGSMHDSDGIYNVYGGKGKRGGKGCGTRERRRFVRNVRIWIYGYGYGYGQGYGQGSDMDREMGMDMEVYMIEGYVQTLIESETKTDGNRNTVENNRRHLKEKGMNL